jgi:acyl-CoA thioesterase FadM
MAGLIRNLLTLIRAWLSAAVPDATSRVSCHFFVTPFDCGTTVLKSDRYLQLAEAAQLDFVLRTRLMGKLLRSRTAFVNASQLVKFIKPIGVFTRVRVETSIVYADSKCAYFSHSLFVRDRQHAEVLVKMKFKRAAVTVPPADVIAGLPSTKHESLIAWDRSLEAIG